jgi:hypothetical protein
MAQAGSVFSQAELDYLHGQRLLGRVAEESSNPVVRHEVPFDRVEVQGLHRWPVAAGW